MRYGLIAAVAGTAALFGVSSAEAAPLGMTPLAPVAGTVHLQPALDTGPAPQIELVRGGCGFGAHRTYSGYCHRNYGWRGRVRAWRRHW